MRSVFFRLCVAAVAAWALALAPAQADDAPAKSTVPATSETPPPAPSEPAAPSNAVLAFITAHPECSELTDECIICAVVNGNPMCSTPGIACIRKDVRCTSTTPPTPKQ